MILVEVWGTALTVRRPRRNFNEKFYPQKSAVSFGEIHYPPRR
jgi:hypothetical protein